MNFRSLLKLYRIKSFAENSFKKNHNIEHDWQPVKYLNVLVQNRTQMQL